MAGAMPRPDFRNPKRFLERVERFLHEADVGDALLLETTVNSIHNVLPSICRVCFGYYASTFDNPRSVAAFVSETMALMMRILDPASPLLRVLLLNSSNTTFVHTIDCEHLPPTAVLQLKSPAPQLPEIYANRVMMPLSDGRSVPTPAPSIAGLAVSTPSLVLTMFEYFVFYLARATTNSPELHMDYKCALLTRYCEFFLPLKEKSNIFEFCSYNGFAQGDALKCSRFFFGWLSEAWMQGLPNAATIHGLAVVFETVVCCELLTALASESPTIVQSLHCHIYKMFSPKFPKFYAHLLDRLPLTDPLSLCVSGWTRFMGPHVRGQITPNMRPLLVEYVKKNFTVYHLLTPFLERATTFTYANAYEWEKQPHNDIFLLHRVIRFFLDSDLLLSVLVDEKILRAPCSIRDSVIERLLKRLLLAEMHRRRTTGFSFAKVTVLSDLCSDICLLFNYDGLERIEQIVANTELRGKIEDIYDVDLKNDKLSVVGRLQLKLGRKKAPPVKRIYQSTAPRDIDFSTEVGFLAKFLFDATEACERAFGVRPPLRFLAEKSILIWLLILPSIVFVRSVYSALFVVVIVFLIIKL